MPKTLKWRTGKISILLERCGAKYQKAKRIAGGCFWKVGNVSRGRTRDYCFPCFVDSDFLKTVCIYNAETRKLHLKKKKAKKVYADKIIGKVMPAEEIRVSTRYWIAGTMGSVPLPPPKRLRTEPLKTGSSTLAVLTSI